MQRRIFLAAAALLLYGCEPGTQTLPFEVTNVTSRVLNEGGGSVSSAAGAAVHIPAASLAGSEEVSLAIVDVPAEISRTGSVASTAFSFAPEGLRMLRPALMELSFEAEEAATSRAWLATVVGLSNGIVTAYGATRVDLMTRTARAEVTSLGTFAVVLPPPAAVHPISRSSGAARATFAAPGGTLAPATDSLSVFCGGVVRPCAGITARATENLLDRVAEAALVYPAIAGTIRLGDGRAEGAIRAAGAVRIRMKSGRTAETYQLDAVLRPTITTRVIEQPGRLTLTNMYLRTEGGFGGAVEVQEEISTLVVENASGTGMVAFGRAFRLLGMPGGETARVTVEIPVRLHSAAEAP